MKFVTSRSVRALMAMANTWFTLTTIIVNKSATFRSTTFGWVELSLIVIFVIGIGFMAVTLWIITFIVSIQQFITYNKLSTLLRITIRILMSFTLAVMTIRFSSTTRRVMKKSLSSKPLYTKWIQFESLIQKIHGSYNNIFSQKFRVKLRLNKLSDKTT